MNRNGSALLVLMLAVLCMAVFVLITVIDVTNDKRIADVGAQMIKSYYEADALAEGIVSEVAAGTPVPGNILGVDVEAETDFFTGDALVSFACPAQAEKVLYVRMAQTMDGYEILEWTLRDVGTWEIDDSLPIWQGEDTDGTSGMPWLSDQDE
jgi:hypothetical protein